jgi:hypothetical protein
MCAGGLQTAIDYEVFAKQPLAAFTGANASRTRRILTNRAALYLSYRVDALNGADDYLPRCLNDVFQALGLVEYSKTERSRQPRVLELCEILVQHRDIYPALTGQYSNRTRHWYVENLATTKVIAIISSGNMDLLQRSTNGNIAALWSKSPWGCPLEAAALGNHVAIATAIVRSFPNLPRLQPDHSYASHFESAIDASFATGHSQITFQVLTALGENFSHLDKSTIDGWIRLATKTQNKGVIEAAFAVKSRENLSSYVDAYKLACETGNLEVTRMFFDNGYLHIKHSLNGWTECPLSIAVASGNEKVVRAVLLLGANPDGCWTLNPRKRPLWHAIAYGSLKMVRVLLEFGANPELVSDAWEIYTTSTRLAADKRQVINECLRQAAERHEYYTDSVEYVTKLAVDTTSP